MLMKSWKALLHWLAATLLGLTLFLVDYAQALPPTEMRTGAQNRTARLGPECFAQRFNCAVVVSRRSSPRWPIVGRRHFGRAKKRDPESWDVSGFALVPERKTWPGPPRLVSEHVQ